MRSSGLVAYAAGKMAQVGIMNALSMEGQEHGILVNAISPVAKTRMWGISQPPEELKPEWVTPGVLYLASALCHDTGYILRGQQRPVHRHPLQPKTVASATP